VNRVQTNEVAVSGAGDGSSGDEHSDSTHKKLKVSKTCVEFAAVLDPPRENSTLVNQKM